MSYIEKKYKNNIFETFNELSGFEKDILNLLNHKSIAYTDKIAKLCAICNKKINLILKKYYPEIKNIDDKLNIKVYLKFYYDLTSLYYKETTSQIEKILMEKIEKKSREFFSMGPLEQEIKKVAQSYGANSVSIQKAKEKEKELMPDAYSIITYKVGPEIDPATIKEVGNHLKDFLESKKYSVLLKLNIIITNAKLLPD
jgi:hypothetical protein